MIGRTLAHYEIVALLGKGGMGEVYRARDTRLGREVALKILPAEIAGDGERVARLQQEARAVAALSHPNILAVFDLGVDEGRVYMAMELLEGESLEERLRSGPLAPRKARELAAQIADGLAAAHERGVIHRDLKPGNVWITRDGRARILDFGLARMEKGAPDGDEPAGDAVDPTVLRRTDPGTVLGTPSYMAPEQVRGEVVDGRADYFALGAILYEMLSGRRAFEEASPAEVMGAILRDDPPPLVEQGVAVSTELQRVLDRCLEKRREERFQSARDLAFALRGAESGSHDAHGVHGGEASNPRRGALQATAALGWLIALVLGTLLLRGSGEEPITDDHVPVRVEALTFSGQDWGIDASPRGDLLAFASERDGTPRIWLKQVAGGGEEPFTEGPDDLPRFSPDGSQILFVRDAEATRTLYRKPLLGGAERIVVDDVAEADWSPDAQEVAFIRVLEPSNTAAVLIGIADAQSGDERVVARLENRAFYGLRWSPDGRRLSVSETSLTGNVAEISYITLIDVETGRLDRRELSQNAGSYTFAVWSPSGQHLLVAQSADMLVSVTGTPGLMLEYDVTSQETRPLFWNPMRFARGGWTASSIAVLGDGRIVFDENRLSSRLLRLAIHGESEQPSASVLTRGLGIDRQPVYSPDGLSMFFSSNRSGNVDLWRIDRSSGRLRQITDDPADDWDPAITPDGRSILWSSNRSGNMEIWMAEVDGSGATRVTDDGVGAENPTMTANGRWIVYTSNNEAGLGIWRIRPDGTEATPLVAGAYLLPEVSPDGRYALFTEGLATINRIHVVEVESGELVDFHVDVRVVARHQNIVFGRARWLPDGSGIVFVDQDEQGRTGISVQDFAPGQNTRGTRRALAGFTQDFVVESLGLSPDGRELTMGVLLQQLNVAIAHGVRLEGW